MRVLLGLHWLTESFNGDQSPPGGFLRFELCRQQGGSSGEWFVKVFFESMSMAQQRDVGRPLVEAVCAGRRLVADGGSRRQKLVLTVDIALPRLHDYRPAAVVRLGGYKCLLKVPHLLTRGLRLQRRPARPFCGQRLATLFVQFDPSPSLE